MAEHDWTKHDLPNPPVVNGNKDLGPWCGWINDALHIVFKYLANIRVNGCGQHGAVIETLTKLEKNNAELKKTARVWTSWRQTGKHLAWILVGLSGLLVAINEIREFFGK